jgi:hypothetical protein
VLARGGIDFQGCSAFDEGRVDGRELHGHGARVASVGHGCSVRIASTSARAR